ncbi:MAG: hypothetical protein KGZ74_05645 [Chitinophagaceae bacterium]|nr:hypothetical protein [Chitinophagaceae bacterium]
MKSSIVKQIIPFFISMLSMSDLIAQKDVNLFAGGNLIVGFAGGDFKNGYSYATGIDASLGAGITKNVYAVGTLGYISYKNEDSNPYGKITLIPLKAGLRVYPYKNFFVAGDAGVGFLKDEIMTSRESRFIYDLGIGAHGELLQMGFYYDGWKRKNNKGSSNTFQIRLGIALR